jgi:tRNA 2-thiocytidine biosynthesis protein TtcA
VETLYQIRAPMVHAPGGFKFASKLERKIVRRAGEAVADHDMLADGDRVMVCVSGGKDSYALLDVLLLLRRRAPIHFDLVAVNVDQGWPGYDTPTIARHLATREVEHRMITADYARIVEAKLEPGETPCVLCSRFRRGFLYDLARELGATKIALGHHLDDAVETLLLNLFFSGRLGAMPPRLTSDDGRNVVIRPLAYVEEADLVAYAEARAYPTVRCGCPSCGLPDQQRQVVKRLLREVTSAHPGAKLQMLAALRNVKPSQLWDRRLLEQLAHGGLNPPGANANVDDGHSCERSERPPR